MGVAVFGSGETIEQASVRTNGRSRGFDYLRIALATAVLVWHSIYLTYDGELDTLAWWRPLPVIILPMFFALSGFLVSGSLDRVRSIHEFILLRAIRLVPALAVETGLSLVIIGSIFTTLRLSEYYTHQTTLAYLWNMVGYVHFYLPGVFQENKFQYINGALWTIPYELECYLLIILLWIFRIVRSPVRLLAAAIAMQLVVPLWEARHGIPTTLLTVSGRTLVLSFVAGILLYAFRKRIRLNAVILTGAIGLSVLLMLLPPADYFIALPAAYITVYLGMKDPPRVPVLLNGDYSYGIYIYGVPIQQAVIAIFPALAVWQFVLPVSLVLVFACAAFSWHFVEKPVLKHRKALVGMVDRTIDHVRGRAERPDSPSDSPMDIKTADDQAETGQDGTAPKRHPLTGTV